MEQSVPVAQAVVAGHSLRGQIYDLLRLAEKLNGQKPFLIIPSKGYPVIFWSMEKPTLELAGKLVLEGPAIDVLECDLRGLCGATSPLPICGCGV